jgi:hypothetical protein
MSSKTILAFGHEAQSGKGECADFLVRAYGGCKIQKLSFASALRLEISQAVQQIAADYMCTHKEASEVLCFRKGIEYDPFAKADPLNPFGKQRKLQQWWGTEYRRAECSTYWTDRVATAIESSDANIIILDDLRFINEAEFVTNLGGYCIKVHRDQAGLQDAESSHVSENQLNDYKFDFFIENNGTLKQLRAKANQVFHTVTQGQLF